MAIMQSRDNTKNPNPILVEGRNSGDWAGTALTWEHEFEWIRDWLASNPSTFLKAYGTDATSHAYRVLKRLAWLEAN